MTDIYLGNTKKARLPYGLRRMVSQVFIILGANDRRELFQGRSRTGGFFWLPGGGIIRPLPPPCLAGVIVLAPSTIRSRIGSEETFCFLGARSPLGNGLLLADGLLELIPMTSTSASLFIAVWSLIADLLFASSILKKKIGKLAIKTNQLNGKSQRTYIDGYVPRT